MKRSYLGVIVMLILGLVILTTGCAKKATVEKTEEVQAPATQEVIPAPAPEKPKEEAQVVAPAPTPSLEEAIKAFEDKDIYFDFDKYTLLEEAKATLAEKAEFLKAHSNMNIQIEGHCDERGTTEYNLALGERRAKAASDYISTLGIAKERISIISYGKEKPADPGHTEEAWAKNRRDHFVIVNK